MPLAQGIRRGQNHILNFYSSISITFPSHIVAISFTYFAQMSSNFSSQYNPEVAPEPCINPQNDRLPQKQQDSSPVSAHKRWSLPKDKDSHKNFIDHGCRLHPKGVKALARECQGNSPSGIQSTPTVQQSFSSNPT
ncbi:hypothetical protein PCANC_04274 [Puccinia coronata f. sp. avenae]|uniref:Uncharacterized protein n=1 Tax=Puccinia coronata f. sp. avenae TaxID=200324 RepID=A0A2N5VUJ2_9BASI|nr:hypothetical protein PCANC_04274 [Puccinia coronata f. sp. avenae]